jgi:hypothetical protein
MGLEKSIEHGKEHRKPYSGAKSISMHCRNNHDCPWCKGNRLYKNKKREEESINKIKDNIDY